MAKRWRKQKAGQQSTKHPRKAMKGSGDSSSAGGTLGGFRNFAKRLVGGGPKAKPKTKSTAARIIDIALWVAVAVAAYVLVSRQCLR